MTFGLRVAMDNLRDLASFLWERKIWWIAPIVILVLLASAFILLTEGQAVLPHVYEVFE